MGWSWRRDNSLDGVDLMQVVPAARVGHTAGDDGRITLLVPRFRTGLAARLLQPRLPEERRYIQVALEARGSALWPLMDGQRRVADMLESFQESFPDDTDEVARRVGQWFYAMYNNGFVRFVNVDTE